MTATATSSRQLAFIAAVEDHMRRAIAAWDGPVALAAREPVLAGGKRLRPLLVLAATPERVDAGTPTVAAAASVELLHTASLVHDDVIDGAHERRGQATVAHAHGVACAVRAGDLLTSLSLQSITGLSRLSGPTTDSEHIAQAVRLLAHTTRSLVAGEALQAEQAHDPGTSIEAYATRCSLKTGVLFGCSMAFGALFGGASDHDVDLLFEVGTGLGVAFQIADDILDCVGDPQQTGKAIGGDIRSGTMTLPLLVAAAREPSLVPELASHEPDVDKVLAGMRTTEADTAAREHADRLLAQTLDKLSELDGQYDFERLKRLATAAIHRSR